MTPESLAALHRACFTTPRPWDASEFADLLGSPHIFLTGTAEGFALGRAIAGEAELLTIAVAPAMRRHGIGRRLMADFAKEASNHGTTRVFLEVAADNTAALALYRASGFHEIGQRPGYYHPPTGPAIDALVMQKDLPGA